RLPGGGAFEHVAQVVGMAVLQAAREVRVPGPRHSHRFGVGPAWLDLHPLPPIDVIEVFDEQAERRAQRATVADAGQDAHAVAFDLHPAAAPVAELPSGKLAVDQGGLQAEPRGQPFQDAEERGPVAFTGGEKSKTSHARSSLSSSSWRRSTMAAGTDRPVHTRNCSAA